MCKSEETRVWPSEHPQTLPLKHSARARHLALASFSSKQYDPRRTYILADHSQIHILGDPQQKTYHARRSSPAERLDIEALSRFYRMPNKLAGGARHEPLAAGSARLCRGPVHEGQALHKNSGTPARDCAQQKCTPPQPRSGRQRIIPWRLLFLERTAHPARTRALSVQFSLRRALRMKALPQWVSACSGGPVESMTWTPSRICLARGGPDPGAVLRRPHAC